MFHKAYYEANRQIYTKHNLVICQIYTLVYVYTTTECQSETLGTAVSQKDTRCHTGSITSVEIPNGIVCFDGLIDGSIATYQCNEGYDLMGNNRLTCQLNGEWLGDVPSNCEPFGK